MDGDVVMKFADAVARWRLWLRRLSDPVDREKHRQQYATWTELARVRYCSDQVLNVEQEVFDLYEKACLTGFRSPVGGLAVGGEIGYQQANVAAAGKTYVETVIVVRNAVMLDDDSVAGTSMRERLRIVKGELDTAIADAVIHKALALSE